MKTFSLKNRVILPPQLRRCGRLAAALLFCGLVLMMCSGPSHAQVRETHLLGSAHLVDLTWPAPCNFPVNGGDAWYYPSEPTRTSCSKVMVSDCPTGDVNNPLPPLLAYVAVSHQPAGPTPLGTVVLLSGDGGTSFFNVGDGSTYVADYYGAGFTTVQFAWAAAWDDNTAEPDVKSVKDEACRPATLLKYIHDNYAVPATGAMCAQGHSGGASELGYAMEFYGADRAANTANGSGYLDTVVMTSGPTLADISGGCHYIAGGSQLLPSNVCHNGVCVGQAQEWQSCLKHPMSGQADCFGGTYPPGDGNYDTAHAVALHTIGIDNPDRPHANCNNFKQTGVDTSVIDPDWTNMSLVPAPYHQYPQTFVYGFLCSGPNFDGNGADTSNSSAAQGWSYLSTLSVSTQQQPNGFPLIYRVDRCADPEMIWASGSKAVGTQPPKSGYQASEQAMEFNCAVH